MPVFEGSNPPIIGDLVGARQRLEIWCCNRDCRRHTYLAPEDAVRLLGANTTFPQAARKLFCSACGARGSGRSRLIQCRGSMEDFYANLAEEGGMPSPRPFNEGYYAATVAREAPRSPVRRGRARRRGGL